MNIEDVEFRPPPQGEERDALAASVGALLRAERKRVGWSQARLAKTAGCSDSSIWNLERGSVRPTPSMLWSLAAVLAPEDGRALAEQLVQAVPAGSLARDTRGSMLRRVSRAQAAQREAGVRKPLPPDAFKPAVLAQPRTPERLAEIVAEHKRVQRELRDTWLRAGTAKPRNRRELAIFMKGVREPEMHCAGVTYEALLVDSDRGCSNTSGEPDNR